MIEFGHCRSFDRYLGTLEIKCNDIKDAIPYMPSIKKEPQAAGLGVALRMLPQTLGFCAERPGVSGDGVASRSWPKRTQSFNRPQGQIKLRKIPYSGITRQARHPLKLNGHQLENGRCSPFRVYSA
jgi:hypothetical protein